MRLKSYLTEKACKAMEKASAPQAFAFWAVLTVTFWGVVLCATAPK